jgi:hypothetical protein
MVIAAAIIIGAGYAAHRADPHLSVPGFSHSPGQ